jgi:hypothetical protein
MIPLAVSRVQNFRYMRAYLTIFLSIYQISMKSYLIYRLVWCVFQVTPLVVGRQASCISNTAVYIDVFMR